MMRPTILVTDSTIYWQIQVYDSAGALVDADSTPTVAIRKNGAATADSVTITKRAATTGIYDCSYNPASESAGDAFTVEETATVSSTAYVFAWGFNVTDSAVTVREELDNNSTKLAAQFDAATDMVQLDTATIAQLVTDIEAALIDEGDGQQLIDAILQVFNANLDLPALELTAIGQAVRTELATELARIDAAMSTRSTLDEAGVRTATGLANPNVDTQLSGILAAASSGGTGTDKIVVAASGDYIKGQAATVVLKTFNSSTGASVVDPVFVVSDCRLLIDGTYQNTSNQPVVISGSNRAELELTAFETDDDRIYLDIVFDVAAHDAADTQWLDQYFELTAQASDIAASLSTVIVPTVVASASRQVNGTTLTAYTNEDATFTVTPVDEANQPLDATGLDFVAIVEGDDKTDQAVVTSMDAVGNGFVQFTVPGTAHTYERQSTWALRRTDTNRPVGTGRYVVKYAPDQDA